jgi:hypothetical protein
MESGELKPTYRPAFRAAGRPARTAGFTLVEGALYMALAGVIGGPIAVLVVTSTRTVAEIDVTASLQERNRVAISGVERDVRDAIASTVLVTDAGRRLVLTLSAGYDGWNVIPGDAVEYRLDLSAEEAAGGFDGDDDDGDGLADDGVLIRRNLTSGAQAVLSGGVDLSASTFARSGSAVMIQMTHFGGAAASGSAFSVTSAMVAHPEN